MNIHRGLSQAQPWWASTLLQWIRRFWADDGGGPPVLRGLNETSRNTLRDTSVSLLWKSFSLKGMVSTRFGPMRNEVAGQSEGPIGTLKIGVKSATELEIF